MYVLVQHYVSDRTCSGRTCATRWRRSLPPPLAAPRVSHGRRRPRGVRVGSRVGARRAGLHRNLRGPRQPQPLLPGGEPRGDRHAGRDGGDDGGRAGAVRRGAGGLTGSLPALPPLAGGRSYFRLCTFLQHRRSSAAVPASRADAALPLRRCRPSLPGPAVRASRGRWPPFRSYVRLVLLRPVPSRSISRIASNGACTLASLSK